MRALKWVFLGVGGLVVLVVAVVAVFVATFDPNDYKPRLVDLVKRQTGRTLAIDGKIGLTLFPKIGAALGKVTLSAPDGPAVFARVDEAHVAVAVLPLLSKQVIVDRVMLKGLAVDLVRHKDGHTNFDDLTGEAARREKPGEAPGQRPPGTPLVLDVGGIVIENATIGWRDERDGTDVRLSSLHLETGRLASGVPGRLEFAARVDGMQPKAALQVNMGTRYRFDLSTQAVALSSLDVKVAGDAPGLAGIATHLEGETVELDPRASRASLSRVELTAKATGGLDAKVSIPRLVLSPDRAESEAITAELALAGPPRSISARLQVAPVSAKGKQIHLPRLDVDLTAKEIDFTVQGKLTTPVTVDLERQQAQLPGIAGDLTISGKALPGPSKASVRGAARADWGAQSASADLAVKLDDSTIDAKVAVASWSRPAVSFNVAADRLDIDRYLPPSRPAAVPGGGGKPAGGAAFAGGKAPAERTIDLSALKSLNATGSVTIGALQMSKIKAEQVAVGIKAAGGRFDLDPISARLYQGTLAGSAAVSANDNRFAVKQRLSGISVGPLLRDAADKDLLEGRGAVALDVTTTGTTVTALKKALAGTANLALKDGAIKGIDIPAVIRTASTLLGSRSALEQESEGSAKTDFTELTASFVIKHGVAHNEDLQATSPLLRLSGRGDIDVGEGTLDYTAKASITAASAGLGGKALAKLAGVTVPVRAVGPLAKPRYSIDVASLATEMARSTLQRELERRTGGGKPGAQPEGGAVGDLLRGLFGKPK